MEVVDEVLSSFPAASVQKVEYLRISWESAEIPPKFFQIFPSDDGDAEGSRAGRYEGEGEEGEEEGGEGIQSEKRRQRCGHQGKVLKTSQTLHRQTVIRFAMH